MRKYYARFLEGWPTARSPGYSASSPGSGACTGFGDSHLWRDPGKCGGSRRAAGGLRPGGGRGKPDQDPWGGRWGGLDYRADGGAVWHPSPVCGRFLSCLRLPVGGRREDWWKRKTRLDGREEG